MGAREPKSPLSTRIPSVHQGLSAKDDKPCLFATDSKLHKVLVQNASLIVSNHRDGN